MENIEKEKTMEKPEVLYHGSPEKDIEEFEPRENKYRNEPPAVYATPEKYLAVMFMHRNTGMAGHFGNVPYAILFGSREECMKLDHGGHLYTLSPDSFEPNVGKGFGGDKEWVSFKAVKPTSKEDFPSVIDEMIKLGIQVYILDRDKYPALHEAKDHGKSILEAAESENQRRGENIRTF